ncbi:hypothetical protein M501DRAFT_978671 [Patellaria atrata CBS 101060]|uniref:Actin-like ATPase domain-containing protein n=1 Tax=Patellaria atrata CBS 101060 TaxID=1346257 RepID=A0A9P4S714_9PEZI|nr:hypothetical protein M501DRAFT_978671 [Patellaria atrata CBS 101060]
MEGEGRPHMIVGIDFGMTCTGVSYANLTLGSENIRWIQKWPGRGQANENKVPTVLVYPTNQPHPSSWGFLSETTAEQTAENKEYVEWFKTYLDVTRLQQKQRDDPNDAAESIEQVEKWYEDYMRLLYQHIQFKLTPELSGSGLLWQDARIEFVFSVPTTWEPHPTVERFRSIIQRAGYGSSRNHTVTIGLTEAEAAAVHMLSDAAGIFQESDILLVCDAGGGTTDLSVLRVKDTQSGSLTLDQLDVVFGETIGSAAIDYDFEKLVRARLEQADQIEPLNLSKLDTAWEMMKSREFQNIKCEFGSPDDAPTFVITIPGLRSEYNNANLGIGNREMRFTRADLQTVFDKQVQKLFRLIDTQLGSIVRKLPNEHVGHLVLSGGLGNSAYVQQQLRSRYAPQSGIPHGGHTMQVRVAPDPQLAVCKGLVGDRLRKLRVGKAILGMRCCRASYGTICKILYDPKNPEHAGRKTEVDTYNKKQYVVKAIDWFIKKGEPVSIENPIVHTFSRKIIPGDPRRAFPTSIVVSYLDGAALPFQLNAECRTLCNLQSDLSGADEREFKRKNRHFWNMGKPYFRVDYEVQVLIGPADIRFELWFNGHKLSRDQPIKVDWVAAPPQSMQPPEIHQESVAVPAQQTYGFNKAFDGGGARATQWAWGGRRVH